MAKNLICLLVGLALVLTLCLVSAEQPDSGGPSRGTPEPPPTEAPEPQMPEYIYQTGTPDLERVKSFYESQEEVLGQRVMELLDYVDSPEGPTIVGAGYGADGYYSVLLDSWNDNSDIIDRTVEQMQELGGEDFPIAFWVGTISCSVKTIDTEEVEKSWFGEVLTLLGRSHLRLLPRNSRR
jgi:hypothetical protein